MSFFNEIKNMLNLDGEGFFKATLVGENALYIEGVKQIISYETDKIVISIKAGVFTVIGVNLYVKKFCMGDVIICGKILSLTRS